MHFQKVFCSLLSLYRTGQDLDPLISVHLTSSQADETFGFGRKSGASTAKH